MRFRRRARPSVDAITGPAPHLVLSLLVLWVAVAGAAVALVALEFQSGNGGSFGSRAGWIGYLWIGCLVLITSGVLAFLASSVGAPPELRSLRLLAVLAPAVFSPTMAAVFYLVERRTDMTEVSEHVVIAAVFTGATATLAIVLLGTFTRLRNRFLQRERRLRALHDASTSLVVEAAGRPAIRAVVGRAAEIVAADRVVLVPEDGFLGVAPQIGETLPGESDIAASAKRVSRPQRTHLGSRPTVAVPVRRDGEVVGVLVASRHEGAGFSDEDVLLLQMFSAALSAGLVVHERLEHAQLLATVEERERVARELHDNLGQLLGFITAKVQAAQALLDRGRHEAAATEMTDLEQAARTLSGDVREAILALRARVGPRRPVAVALADYVRDFSVQTGITVEVQASTRAGGSLAGSSQYQVLRIAQEALSNVRRHAGTATARVVLAESGGRLELVITDDGTGFDASRIESGFGLRGMAERAHRLQGTLDVCSVPGQGTTVSLDVPLHPWEVSSDETPSDR